MPQDQELPDEHDPKPDPWSPPGAGYLQAASIGTGAAGVGLLVWSAQLPEGEAELR